MKNDFYVDTNKQIKKEFLKKVQMPLNIALVLTLIQTICAIMYFINGVTDKIWKEVGMSAYVTQGIQYLSMVCIFVSLIMVIASEKPFSHTLIVCIRVISIIYILGAVVFPRLPGYETSFGILSYNNFVLMDGNVLTTGIVIYVLSIIVNEGFSAQQEIEQTI